MDVVIFVILLSTQYIKSLLFSLFNYLLNIFLRQQSYKHPPPTLKKKILNKDMITCGHALRHYVGAIFIIF